MTACLFNYFFSPHDLIEALLQVLYVVMKIVIALQIFRMFKNLNIQVKNIEVTVNLSLKNQLITFSDTVVLFCLIIFQADIYL